MRIVMIHQPHFLPWMGYFNKILNANHFIILDDVQYRPRYFQNRTKIMYFTGTPLWLSVPVHAQRHTKIKDVLIAGEKWKNKMLGTIYRSYCKTDYFLEIWYLLRNLIETAPKKLIDLNYQALKLILQILNWNAIQISFSSEYNINYNNPNDRIVKLCKCIKASHYLYGEGGGPQYHNPNIFLKEDIGIIKQNFLTNHPEYKQYNNNGFQPKLSIIDALFNIGPKKTKNLIVLAWKYNN